MTRNDWWPAPSRQGAIDATVSIPGSKSLTNRVLVLSALANGPSCIRGALNARDTRLMVDGLRVLGARISSAHSVDRRETDIDELSNLRIIGPLVVPPTGFTADSENLLTRGANTPLSHGADTPATIACGLAGTVMRFLPALAALRDKPITFTADDQAQSRPLTPLLRALEDMGATVRYGDSDLFPFTLHGPVHAREISLESSESSQFVTALLLVAPVIHTSGTVTIRLLGQVPSRPHIDMTIQCLRDRGIEVDEPDERTFTVHCASIDALDTVIEPDLSNAGPFLAAALVSGGTVRIPRWPAQTTQAGDAWREILTDMGAQVTLDTTLTVSAGRRLAGIHRDFSSEGELVPTAAAVAVCADSPSTFTGIGHLRGHETDRLSALATEIAKLGVKVDEGSDYLHIDPTVPWREHLPHRIDFETYHDHRMATFAAIIGLAVPGIHVCDIETTSKTLPDFTRMWTQMLDASATERSVTNRAVQ